MNDTTAPKAKSPVRPGVLSGIRVLDFTWKTVGPWAPRLLTHYGAEVIHVERAGGFDDHRYNVDALIRKSVRRGRFLAGVRPRVVEDHVHLGFRVY